MQYLLSVISSDAEQPDPDRMPHIDRFNDRMQADGNWVFAGGLGAPHTATTVDGRPEAPIVTDGPFVETREYVIGLWVVEAPDLDAALRLATAGSEACGLRVEVRPFLAGPESA